jgi:hypothetical protein
MLMTSIIKGYSYDIHISYRLKENKYDSCVAECVDQLKNKLKSTYPNRYYAD